MSHISDLSQAVKSPDDESTVSIRGGRVVRMGSLTGPQLRRAMRRCARHHGLSLDELHATLTRITLISIRKGPPPVSGPEEYGLLIRMAHQQSLEPLRFTEL